MVTTKMVTTKTPASTAITTRLAELTQEWVRYYSAIEANDGVETPELEAAHSCLVIDSGIKVDGYYFRLEMMEGQLARLKKVRQDLEKREKRLAADIERMENRVWEHMEARGLEELRGDVLQGFRIQDASGVRSLELVVEDPLLWPEWMRKVTTEVDKEKVRAAIGSGEGFAIPDQLGDVTMARLKPRGKVLRRYV